MEDRRTDGNQLATMSRSNKTASPYPRLCQGSNSSLVDLSSARPPAPLAAPRMCEGQPAGSVVRVRVRLSIHPFTATHQKNRGPAHDFSPHVHTEESKEGERTMGCQRRCHTFGDTRLIFDRDQPQKQLLSSGGKERQKTRAGDATNGRRSELHRTSSPAGTASATKMLPESHQPAKTSRFESCRQRKGSPFSKSVAVKDSGLTRSPGIEHNLAEPQPVRVPSEGKHLLVLSPLTTENLPKSSIREEDSCQLLLTVFIKKN